MTVHPREWQLFRRDAHGALSHDDLVGIAGNRSDGLEVRRMPAMVHTVLRDHGVIPDPWKPGVAAEVTWVAEVDWVYRAEFGGGGMGTGPILLQIGGADTVLDVYVNGEHVGSSETAYEPITHDVTGFVRDANVLLLHVRSVFRPSGGHHERLLCVDDDLERPIRKTEQNFNTYLGPHPYFCRVGVYGPVEIVDSTAGRVERFSARTSMSPDLNRGTVLWECDGLGGSGYRVRIDLLDAAGAVVASDRHATTSLAEPDARPGSHHAPFSLAGTLVVDGPLLWWPRGYGSQPLYTLRATLESAAPGAPASPSEVDEPIDRAERTVGFRLVRMPHPLHFAVNGVPVKLWGADWVSPDWTETAWNHERASTLLDLAENAHMNVIRVWGVVESAADDFYEMCDRRGILVWQDFTDIRLEPNDVNRRIARSEASALLHRLRHHPCILMWCGDNESAMWHDFGGATGPFPGREIAEDVIGGAVRELDPDRVYLPSTPYYGFDANDPQDHNTHGYTNVWFVHGYDYLNFATEDTRISAPELRSLRRFMRPGDIYPSDFDSRRTPGNLIPWPEEWAGYTTSISERKVGPVEQFFDATDAESLVYRIGMAAGVYYRDTIERQRRGRPAGDASGVRRCGGYIVWKLNDSWPEIYSAKVDYFLEPYIAYYLIRRAYAPVLVSIDVGTYIHVWVVNDTRDPVHGELTVRDWHIEENRSSRSLTRAVHVEPGCSAPIVELTEFRTIERRHILHATLDSADGTRLGESVVLLDLERNLPFPEARLRLRCTDGVLEVETDQFARSVTLSGDADGDEFGWFFEDNYFDLVPGEPKRVRVLGRHTSGTIRAKAVYSPHVASVNYSGADRQAQSETST